MSEYLYVTLREKPELKEYATEWFHGKWGVPKEAYLECMETYHPTCALYSQKKNTAVTE